MRRFLIIFLLFILPLQVSWAAVGSYCKHETGAAAKHFGHHEHKHHPQKSEPTKDSSGRALDKDCAVCHLGAAGMITTSTVNASTNLQVAERIATEVRFFKPLSPDRPERPKWVRAV